MFILNELLCCSVIFWESSFLLTVVIYFYLVLVSLLSVESHRFLFFFLNLIVFWLIITISGFVVQFSPHSFTDASGGNFKGWLLSSTFIEIVFHSLAAQLCTFMHSEGRGVHNDARPCWETLLMQHNLWNSAVHFTVPHTDRVWELDWVLTCKLQSKWCIYLWLNVCMYMSTTEKKGRPISVLLHTHSCFCEQDVANKCWLFSSNTITDF